MRMLIIGGAALVLTPFVSAVTITSAPVAPIPLTPGNGLVGSYYQNGNVQTNADAATYVYNHTPTATFNATSIDYSGGDTETLGAFLGADAATLNPSSAASIAGLGGQIISFTGYIALQQGDNNLGTDTDDGSQVLIAGQQVVNSDGPHGPNLVTGTATVPASGLYPITFTYFEIGGGTQAQLTDGTGATLSESVLYTPEPASLALLGLGAASLLARRRNR